MILYEKGLLNFDDNLYTYYPKLSYKDFTIRQMLNHTSGLPNVLGLIFQELDHSRYFSNDDIADLLLIHSPKISFDDGSKFEYSNLGYELLAGIVEKVSGQDYVDFLRQNIFAPLKMSNTFHFSESSELQGLNEIITVDNFHLMTHGASNIYSTAEDLLKWDAALNTEQILKKQTLDFIYERPVIEGSKRGPWGLGWNIINPDTADFIVQFTLPLRNKPIAPLL